jgi:CTP-dependent riboflavin kinase
VNGLGEAPEFTQLAWVVDQCREKLGFAPFPGTVNLEVLTEDFEAWQELKARPGAILVPPNPAFCDALCHPVSIAGRISGSTIEPHVQGYPPEKLELLAPCPVVETLGLTIGQEVSIEA